MKMIKSIITHHDTEVTPRSRLVLLERPGKQAKLRVALVAGTLGQGGAEKQLVYMAQALHNAGVSVRVYCLTKGEYYEDVLRSMGVKVVWIGRHPLPLVRMLSLARMVSRFRPHVVQSTHFYTNLYSAVMARLFRAVGIGSVRNDARLEVDTNGKWGKLLLHMPSCLLINSAIGKKNAHALGVPLERLYLLPNVIDIKSFNNQSSTLENLPEPEIEADSWPLALSVANLFAYKRLDRFLSALALARGAVRGAIAGEGPERPRLEALATELGLSQDQLQLLGRRSDIPRLMRKADMLVLTSDHEGFPNVILEAMAAGLPVITTPAGDAGAVVQHGVTGYVVPFDDVEGLAGHMMELASSPELGQRMGAAGQTLVECNYSAGTLATQLLTLYRQMARQQVKHSLLRVLIKYEDACGL